MTTQLITPDPNVPCKPGWCLLYVQDAYGLRPDKIRLERNAAGAWADSQYKHEKEAPPSGLWAPGFASISDNSDGHVFLFAPDGSVYSSSSPTAKTAVHHASLAALIQYYGKDKQGHIRLTYLGWTEDVEGILVIKEEEMLTKEQIQVMYTAFTVGEGAPDDHIAAWVGKSTDEYLTYMASNKDVKARVDHLRALDAAPQQYQLFDQPVYIKK